MMSPGSKNALYIVDTNLEFRGEEARVSNVAANAEIHLVSESSCSLTSTQSHFHAILTLRTFENVEN
jgi:hypothetical protein